MTSGGNEEGQNRKKLADFIYGCSLHLKLLWIFYCFIFYSKTGEPPVGRGPTRKVMSAKELKQVQDDKQALTAHFIQTLPPLLKKYLPGINSFQN